jgi:hypothetical protein
MKRLRRQGKLRLDDKYSASPSGDPFAALLVELQSQPWVVYIQAPPRKNASPERVLKYLARYMTGGPISDRRLSSHVANEVTFLARSTEKSKRKGPTKLVPVTLSGVEFTRRWSLHILPKGYTKVRRYGGYSNRHCESYLNRCRRLLDFTPVVSDPESETDSHADSDSSAARCPKCSGPMTCIGATERPGWSTVMASPDRPHWYRDG